MWLGDQHVTGDAGFFVEAVRPSTARFETLFSNDRLEGIARLAGTLSGEVAEHAYWGGARDRLPQAQADPLAPGDPPAPAGDGTRQVVRGRTCRPSCFRHDLSRGAAGQYLTVTCVS
jgi:aldoxime dehydratase